MCDLDFILHFMKRLFVFWERREQAFLHPHGFSLFQSQVNIFWPLFFSDFMVVAWVWASFMLMCLLMKALTQPWAREQEHQGHCQILPLLSYLSISLVPHGSLPSVSGHCKYLGLLACWVVDISSIVIFQNLAVFHLVKNVCGMRSI